MRSILNRPTLLADLAYPFIAKPNGAGIAAAADGTQAPGAAWLPAEIVAATDSRQFISMTRS